MPIFRVKSVKIYTGQKNLHWRRQPRQWQLSGMLLSEKNHVIMIPLPGVRLATSMWSTATRSGWLLILSVNLSLLSCFIFRMKIAIMKAIIKIIRKWSNSNQSSPDWISQWVARIVTLSPRWVFFRVRGTFLNRSLGWNVLPDKRKWFNFVATIL